jgi:CheY-like chemotaxis protein
MERHAVPIAAVVDEAMHVVEILAAHHGVILHIDALHGSAHADRHCVLQVLVHLLCNAILYNHPQGQVIASSFEHGDHVCLRVSDTGRGIAAPQLARLFTRLPQPGPAPSSANGAIAGQGLALVHSLVERMGGAIRVTSELGLGSTFELRLPRTPLLAAAPPPALGPAEPIQILYIEDNLVNQILVEALVRRQSGLVIESQDTGAKGLARARALRPQLILIDIQLPDMTGYDILKVLRSEPEMRDIHCIALSANARAEDISRALIAGFDDYWTKPIDFDAFTAAMQRLFPASV